MGWGESEDEESIAAIKRAVDLGVTFFDTADVYGAGRSERLLGLALHGRRDQVVIGSKWGNVFDEDAAVMTGARAEPEYVRVALLDSLRRLRTDYLDLYQLHLSHATPAEGRALRDACDELVSEGLIRWYAWSTDDPDRARIFADGAGCAALQFECSVLHDAPELIALAESRGVASITRSPLAMGLLSGKYGTTSELSVDDIRRAPPSWLRYFTGRGPAAPWLAVVDRISDVLRSGERTPAQGALAWLWARSRTTVPIPGFRSVAQVEENVAALERGPFAAKQMLDLERLIGARS